MMGSGVEVFVRGGRLMLRFLTPIPALFKGFPLLPADDEDPYVFRIDLPGLESMRVVLAQDSEGATARLHFDLMPLTLHKRPAASNPRRWATGALGAVAAGGAAIALRRCRAAP
jgi:hypothetical protein